MVSNLKRTQLPVNFVPQICIVYANTQMRRSKEKKKTTTQQIEKKKKTKSIAYMLVSRHDALTVCICVYFVFLRLLFSTLATTTTTTATTTQKKKKKEQNPKKSNETRKFKKPKIYTK